MCRSQLLNNFRMDIKNPDDFMFFTDLLEKLKPAIQDNCNDVIEKRKECQSG